MTIEAPAPTSIAVPCERSARVPLNDSFSRCALAAPPVTSTLPFRQQNQADAGASSIGRKVSDGQALATHQKQPGQQEQHKENYHPQQGEAARRHTILLANGWEAA
jgi:hypothetical protein